MANTKIKGSNIEANAIETGHFHTNAFTDLNQHLIPDTNSVYDLGTAEKKWRDLYLSSATIYLGDNTKMSVDSDGNLEVKDENDNPKAIKAKSLEIDDVNADPTFKTVMKKVNGKMKFVKVNRSTGIEESDSEEVDLSMNSIGDLSNVDLTTAPTLNQTIIWNGTSFVPGESFSQSDFNTAFAAKTVGDLSDGSSYATTSYVDTEVAGIVSSAPATLDTLNELAAALGDDPNFATTVSTNIGTKWTQDNTKISNWDTAYGWGNHGSAGYLTSYTETDPVFSASAAANVTNTKISNWDTAYGWGNHASAGYLTSETYSSAGELLTAIKTVDGSGSGLDADLLDGIQSSAFYRYTTSPGTPSSSSDTVISIGTNGSSYDYVQSHSSKPLNLNPVGNTVQIAGNTVWHDGLSSVNLPTGTSDPSTTTVGAAYFNTTDSKLMIYTGPTDGWGEVTFAPEPGTLDNPAANAQVIADYGLESGLYYITSPSDGVARQWYVDVDTTGGPWVLVARASSNLTSNVGNWFDSAHSGFTPSSSGFFRGGGFWNNQSQDYVMVEVNAGNGVRKVRLNWAGYNFNTIPSLNWNQFTENLSNAEHFASGYNGWNSSIKGANNFSQQFVVTWSGRGAGGNLDSGEWGKYFMLGTHYNGTHQHHEEGISGNDSDGTGIIIYGSNWKSGGMAESSNSGYVNFWVKT